MTCKDCEKRYLACHDSCEDYQAEKRKREELKEKKRKELLGPYIHHELKEESYFKNKRRH